MVHKILRKTWFSLFRLIARLCFPKISFKVQKQFSFFSIDNKLTKVPIASLLFHLVKKDHQIVMALPSIDSAKVWVGKVSWISNEPIEVGFLIGHNKSAEHSHPARLQVNKSSNLVFASTNLTGSTPQKTFGNLDFVVDQLLFHSTNNRKFTVTLCNRCRCQRYH